MKKDEKRIKAKFALLDCKYEIQNTFEEHFDNEKFQQNFSANYAKVKIYVMAHGRNRNHSEISKESVEKAIMSLGCVPIVGEWKQYEDGTYGFGSHGGKLEITDQSITYTDTTTPYGFTPPNVEYKWETIVEKNGVDSEEYLVCDGYLFAQKYEDQVNYILNNGVWQSMEIEIEDGFFDDENYLVVNDFKFSALCILNKSSDVDKNVEPCFPSANIQSVGSFNKFEKEFKEMLINFNKACKENNKRGDTKMEFDVKYLPENYSYLYHTEKEVFVVNTETNTVDKIEYTMVEKDGSFEMQISTESNLYEFKVEVAEEIVFNVLESTEYVELDTKYQALLGKVDAYEMNEKQLLIDKFDKLISEDNESYSKIKDALSDYTVDELNKELKVIYAEQKMNEDKPLEENKFAKQKEYNADFTTKSKYSNLF